MSRRTVPQAAAPKPIPARPVRAVAFKYRGAIDPHMLTPLSGAVNTTLINVAGAVVGLGSIVLALAWWRYLAR